jgi:hypothetical protein
MYVGRVCTGFVWLSLRPVANWFEHGNEPSRSIKWEELFALGDQ